MRRFVEKLISRIKGEPYALPENLRTGALLSIALEKGACVARGALLRLRLGGGHGIIFKGRNVRVRHAGYIRAGKGLILNDNVRIDALCDKGVRFGRNVTVGASATIECTGVIRNLGESLCVGDYAAIGAYSFIGVRGPVTIGRDTIMGPFVSIHAENHRFSEKNVPIRLQGETRKGVVIGENCWIGAKATILDGVHIGNGAVIAAGAVVTRDVPEFGVYGGVPARSLEHEKGER